MEAAASFPNLFGAEGPLVRILLMYSPSSEHLEALRRSAPDVEIVVAKNEQSAKERIIEADAVLGNRFFLQSLPYAKRLRWMQSNSVGMDLLFGSGLIPSELQITSAKGLYDGQIAEHAIALLLALLRNIPQFCEQQNRAIWRRCSLRTIAGARCLVLGWGKIGQAIGERLRALGAEVSAVSRCGPQAWRDLLPTTDVLLMALPSTPLTAQIIGEKELALLPATSYLVNVGRGETLDEESLVAALRNERLAGAALDVFAEEPLPAESSLWKMPRLLITPHVARSIESAPQRWEPLFVENLRRFVAGEPLLNCVDHTLGY